MKRLKFGKTFINITTYSVLVFFFVLYYEVISIPKYSFIFTATPFIVFSLPYAFVFVLSVLNSRYFNFKVAGSLFILILFTQYFIVGRPHFQNTLFRAPTQNERIRVCSWNSAYFFDWSKDDGFRLLQEADCDVIALQEVWKADFYYEELKSYRDTYFPESDIRIKDEFVFIIPQVSDKELYISESEGHFGAKLNIKGHEIIVINTHIWNPIAPKPFVNEKGKLLHMDPVLVRTNHEKELNTVIEQLTKEETPLIVVGDFNTQPNVSLIRDLTKIGEKANRLSIVPVGYFRNPNSYPANKRLLQIDYAYVSKQIRPEAKTTFKCYNTASDHCLLILDVLL